ncbi:MAG: amino acid adenylation domain-containing protein, partial [bacterium]|nr:amino acid adenylation domain-containing protein [bacterium]
MSDQAEKLDTISIEDIIVLTPSQQGILFHYLHDPGQSFYFEQLCLALKGEIDPGCFRRAWDFVVQSNEMLRTMFRWENVKQPVQVILKQQPVTVIFHDYSDKEPTVKQQSLDRLKRTDRDDRFDLAAASVPFRITLCKLEKENYEMIVSNHRILYDGWSTGLILKEFFLSYAAIIRGEKPGKPGKQKYKEFISHIYNQDKVGQKLFWVKYFNGVDAPSRMTVNKPNPQTGGDPEKEVPYKPEQEHYSFHLSRQVKRKLEQFCKTRKIDLAALFYSVWGVLLLKYNNSRDVVFGTTVSGRSGDVKGIEDIAGLFVNTLPFRFLPFPAETIEQLIRRVNKELNDRKPYEGTPLFHVREYSGLDKREELFDTVLSIENYPLDSLITTGDPRSPLSVEFYEKVGATHYPFTLRITLMEDIEVQFTYQNQLFEDSIMTKLRGHFSNLMEDMVDNHLKTIGQLEILSEDEKTLLIEDFNKTDAGYPMDKTIHEILADQAGYLPDLVAVGSGEHQLTFTELNESARRLAGQLNRNGIRTGDIVAIMAERSLEMLTGIMGILKTGAAYLPIDPDDPEERIRFMLKDSGAKVIITMELVVDGSDGLIVKKLDGSGEPTNPPANQQTNEPTNLAYILYTSGTTGKPKGVMIQHDAVVNRMYWMLEKYDLTEKDVILHGTVPTFDVSVCEMFRWILPGASLCILPPGDEKEPGEIVKTIGKHHITIADFIPTHLSPLLDYVEQQDAARRLTALRWFFTGAEVVELELVQRFNRVLFQTNQTRLVNAYGPTESTVDVTYFDCSGVDKGSYNEIPIGRPMNNMRIYILDRYGRIQPVGIYGELCVVGVGLARGYLNRPVLTATKFNARLYRTGDLACWLPDGNIKFAGRMDRQVKVRGVRVEPEEVRLTLLKHPNVGEAAVLVKDTGANNKTLVAYVVSEPDEPDGKELKRYLEQYLPISMIPGYIIPLDAFPLTVKGKPDLDALPDPVEPGLREDREVEEPRNRPEPQPVAQETPSTYTPIEPVEMKPYYDVSHAQRNLWALDWMEGGGSIAENRTGAFMLEGDLDTRALQKAFDHLAARHEALRTTFTLIDGVPKQDILPGGNIPIREINLENEEKAEDIPREYTGKEMTEPFDLEKGPLLRVTLLKLADTKYRFLFTIHHIVGDARSVNVLTRELAVFYSTYKKGETPAPQGPRIQYKDYCAWQSNRLQGEAARKSREYWHKKLAGQLPVLELPVDRSRPPVRTLNGGRLNFILDEDPVAGLRELSKQHNATLFMVVLALV